MMLSSKAVARIAPAGGVANNEAVKGLVDEAVSLDLRIRLISASDEVSDAALLFIILCYIDSIKIIRICMHFFICTL